MTTATPTASFTVTEEQRLLRATVRELIAARATSERVREVMLGDEGYDRDAWAELAQTGLTGLTVPERFGGAGATFAELAIVIEEAGRRLLPVPLLSSAVLGTEAVLAAGTEQQCAALLPAVAEGRTTLALAHLDERGGLTSEPGVAARRDGEDWVLQGTAGYVVDGASAEMVVTAAVSDEGLVLLVVPGESAGLERRPLDVLDLTRPMATLVYDGVRVDDDARLAGDDAMVALHRALSAGVVAVACEQVGGAGHVLEMTTGYARDRIQFGRAIGSFQAVKHRLAELLVQVESARSVAEHAARVLAAGDRHELAIAAPMAKSYCSEVFEQASADGIQLHGGIGFTWEHDAHLYFKRAKATKLLLGSPSHHRALLAEVLSL